MTTRDGESGARTLRKRLGFDRYVLDLERGCLLLQGSEIALRPKTFAVLQYLVENCGRLVPKDELFSAIWPNLAVTDDALVQSIGELRRALGPGDGPRLIKTVPRRGYRLESRVTVAGPPDESSFDDAPVAATFSGVVRSPQSDGAPRLGPAWFAARPRRGRIGALVVLAAAVLLAAGALWTVAGPGLKFPGVPGDAGQFESTAAKPAIAVLPFANRSDDSSRDYFADGLTQDIISALGRFSALTVLSWNAVYPFKEKPASPAEVGQRLAVGYVVEGSVQQAGDRVRVDAQLVDTGRQQVLWSGQFDEARADVFALQDKITAEIVRVLSVRLTEIEQRRVFAKPTGSLDAYDSVLRARPALQRPTRANNVEARDLLKRAIGLDPNYAAAYAALAETYYTAASMGWAESPIEALDHAEELALQALSLDSSEPRAHIILGRIDIFHQRYPEAQKEIEAAIAVNPNDAQSLAGRGNILMWLGQTDAAIEALEQAERIDPELKAMDSFALSLAYYLKGRYDAAIAEGERNLRETDGAVFSRIIIAAAYAEQDRADDAAHVVATIHQVDPTFDPQTFGTKFLNAVDLERLRDGLHKAGLYPVEAEPPVVDPSAG
jgi:adenylate cyclase